MKQDFTEYEPLLISLKEALHDEKVAKRAKKALARQIIDTSKHDDDDLLESNELLKNIRKSNMEKTGLAKNCNCFGLKFLIFRRHH